MIDPEEEIHRTTASKAGVRVLGSKASEACAGHPQRDLHCITLGHDGIVTKGCCYRCSQCVFWLKEAEKPPGKVT